jgi:hypothetical protein
MMIALSFGFRQVLLLDRLFAAGARLVAFDLLVSA